MLSATLAFVAAAAGTAGVVLAAPVPRRPTGPGRGLRLLSAVGGPLPSRRAPSDLAARIEAAGRPAGLGVREVMTAKVVAAIAGGLAAVPLAELAPGRLGVVVAPLAPVAGFLAPDLWLRRIALERARRVRRDLPALLDILRISVEAGGSLASALGAVGERAEGPLAREWEAVAGEVALGVPLERALDGLAARLPQPEIRAFASAVRRAARHGAPLAQTLEAQAKAARFALARRIREDAARAGPKIQLVVALLLVPSVLLLVAAALASALLDGGADALPAVAHRPLGEPPSPATRPTRSRFCKQLCIQTRLLHAKTRFRRVSVPPRANPIFRLHRAKNSPTSAHVRASSDRKVGNRVAEWEKVGYRGITNRPEWRGSSHSATPVRTLLPGI